MLQVDLPNMLCFFILESFKHPDTKVEEFLQCLILYVGKMEFFFLCHFEGGKSTVVRQGLHVSCSNVVPSP